MEKYVIIGIGVIVLFVIVYFIGFLIWWNRMERKKDEIMMRMNDNTYKMYESLFSKKEEQNE